MRTWRRPASICTCPAAIWRPRVNPLEHLSISSVGDANRFYHRPQTKMSRPAVEVADILRAQGNGFLDRYREESSAFSSSKPIRAIQSCRTAALGRPSSMPVRGAATRPSPIIRAGTAIVRSAKPSARTLDRRPGTGTSRRPTTSTSSSPCLTNSMCSPWTMQRVFYDLFFPPAAQTCLEVAADPGHLGARDRGHQHSAHLGTESAAPSSHPLRDSGRRTLSRS